MGIIKGSYKAKVIIERLPKSGRLNGSIVVYAVKKKYKLGKITEEDLMHTFDNLKYNPGAKEGDKETWRIVVGPVYQIGRNDYKTFKKNNPDRVREIE